MSLSAANAIIMLSITGVFPTPVQLQGFGTDDVVDGERLVSAQVQMGVDGNLSAGFVYVEYKQNITLQADSSSNALFDAWWSAMQVAQDVFPANAVITLAGVSTKWSMTRGFLTGYPPIPDAGKLLKPRKFEITWQRVLPTPA